MRADWGTSSTHPRLALISVGTECVFLEQAAEMKHMLQQVERNLPSPTVVDSSPSLVLINKGRINVFCTVCDCHGRDGLKGGHQFDMSRWSTLCALCKTKLSCFAIAIFQLEMIKVTFGQVCLMTRDMLVICIASRKQICRRAFGFS